MSYVLYIFVKTTICNYNVITIKIQKSYLPITIKSTPYPYHSSHNRKNVRRHIMKTVNLQVRINEDLKQEVSSILKAQGLSYTSMLDALFRQIIKERRIPFAIALPTTSTDETPTPSTLNNDGTYEHPRTTLKASDTTRSYRTSTTNEVEISFDKIDKTGILNIRINPKVKTLTTAILKEMGLTISLLVTLISKQIQFLKAIPNSVNKPIACDSMNADFLTDEEIDLLLELAYADIEQGNLISAEDLFEQLKKEGLLL